MANVLFKRGNTATINGTAIADGQLLYNTTTGQQYIDVGTTRIAVGKPVDTALSTTSTNAIANNAITTSIVNTTAEVSAITNDYIPCGTKPVKELITNLNVTEGTLVAGQTSITISDARITATGNRFKIYVDTDHQKVMWSSFTFTTGSITIVFPVQATNMVVGIEVKH